MTQFTSLLLFLQYLQTHMKCKHFRGFILFAKRICSNTKAFSSTATTSLYSKETQTQSTEKLNELEFDEIEATTYFQPPLKATVVQPEAGYWTSQRKSHGRSLLSKKLRLSKQLWDSSGFLSSLSKTVDTLKVDLKC